MSIRNRIIIHHILRYKVTTSLKRRGTPESDFVVTIRVIFDLILLVAIFVGESFPCRFFSTAMPFKQAFGKTIIDHKRTLLAKEDSHAINDFY